MPFWSCCSLVVLGLVFSVLSQEIGKEERLQNDLFCPVGRKTVAQPVYELYLALQYL